MKKCTAKRVLKWIGITLGALLIIIAAGAAVMFGPFVKAANGIEKLEDGLYAMEFAGDYGFDDFLPMAALQATAKLRNIWFHSCRMAFIRLREMCSREASAVQQYIRRMKTAPISLAATMTGQNVKP